MSKVCQQYLPSWPEKGRPEVNQHAQWSLVLVSGSQLYAVLPEDKFLHYPPTIKNHFR